MEEGISLCAYCGEPGVFRHGDLHAHCEAESEIDRIELDRIEFEKMLASPQKENKQ